MNIFSAIAGLTGIPVAHAQGLTVWCGTMLAGCGQQGEILSTAMVAVLSIMVALAGTLSTLFFIYGALQMVMPWFEGSEENGKKTIEHSLIGLGIALLSGVIVELVASESFNGGGTDPFLAFVRGASTILQTVFNSFFFVAIIYAGIQMIMDRGKGEKYGKGLTIIRWAITGGVLLNLSKAILDAFVHLLTLG